PPQSRHGRLGLPRRVRRERPRAPHLLEPPLHAPQLPIQIAPPRMKLVQPLLAPLALHGKHVPLQPLGLQLQRRHPSPLAGLARSLPDPPDPPLELPRPARPPLRLSQPREVLRARRRAEPRERRLRRAPPRRRVLERPPLVLELLLDLRARAEIGARLVIP